MSTKITVNQKEYDSVDEMPADVREIYELAMKAASTATPDVKHSEIKVMFQLGGSAPKFHTRPASAPTGEKPSISLVEPGAAVPLDVERSRPIEPAPGVGIQVLLVVAAGLAIALAFWYWASR